VRHTVPFLICDNCHAAIEMEDEKVSHQLEEKARALGFTPMAQTLEVHGYCKDCAKASPAVKVAAGKAT
jgi:Fur family zinc uptake transcriptional regulator